MHEPLIRYRTRPDQISKNPTLNNSDDAEILRRQEAHLDPELYERVRVFHRRVASLRYKENAYDSLFRLKSRRRYWKWLWQSVVVARHPPSFPSLVYLALSAAPFSLIDRVAELKKRAKGAGSDNANTPTRHQKVAEEFEWAGVRRGSIPNLPPMATRNLSP